MNALNAFQAASGLRRRALLILTLARLSLAAADPTAPAQPAPTPTLITAGPDWIALQPELDIEAGSALDFSGLGFTESPAGRHGRVIANSDGQFAFADSPAVARRFYGVNLCFSAQFLSSEEAERLATRLVRLGYNTVRIHHYERDLTHGQRPSTGLDPEKLAQFDALTSTLIRHGIYLTTDLFVSRSVPWREIGFDRDGAVPMDTFKILVPVNVGAWTNWQAFARNLLGHVNPSTGRSYAQEPALAWLSMINEGNYGNFFKELREFPDWSRAWNRWLEQHYGSRAALAAAWGEDLKPEEDPAAGSVRFPPGRLWDPGLRTRDCIVFLSDTERDTVARMKTFLRDDLGCHALISNANAWTYFVTDQSARVLYDYVDDHFYVDHPEFLEGSWRLPSKCPNTSPIAGGAPGGRSRSFTRLLDKPFTITEYNYSGPGRFRGVGGILTGALGALQGWSGIWRFAYSHSREAMFTPSRLNYFDVAADPLSQAAERASLCLFLRGDLQPAPHTLAIVMTGTDLASPAPRIPNLEPRWPWTAWITRVGTQVLPDLSSPPSATLLLPLGWKTPAADYPKTPGTSLDPYAANDSQILALLRETGILVDGNPTVPSAKLLASETREILIDGPRDTLTLDTPRTAGGYAPAGGSIEATAAGVRIAIRESDATVWVSALERQPIRHASRLLITHLTDLQNTDIRYAEPARRTLLDWGHLPHLVRAGQATVRLRLQKPERYRVWALAPSGRRLAEVPTTVESGELVVTLNVAADPAGGARMLYELRAEP